MRRLALFALSTTLAICSAAASSPSSQFVYASGTFLVDSQGNLENDQIGWAFWPYKNVNATSSFVSWQKPDNWDEIVAYGKMQEKTGSTEKRIAAVPHWNVPGMSSRVCLKTSGSHIARPTQAICRR